MKDCKIVILDTETNGLPQTDRKGNADFANVHPVEIGAKSATWAGGYLSYDSVFSTLVRLPRGATMSKEAAAINGLDGKEGRSPEEALATLAIFLDEIEPDFVAGHNAAFFDLPMLHTRAMDMAVRPMHTTAAGILLHYCTFRPLLDTKLIWTAWCHGLRRKPWEPLRQFYGRAHATPYPPMSSLEFVRKTLCQREAETAHRALADAAACADVLGQLLFRGLLDETLGELP